MSSSIVIRVENLGKKYRIHHQTHWQRNAALREILTAATKSVLLTPWSIVQAWRRRTKGLSTNHQPPATEDFWALRDVTFEVARGEVVGIIGRNGAGKSTLLKILSRITEPTTGRVRVDGRLSSLLEVGTGFHPELTGRENIYLNGAILGMSRNEINRKFDEIVAFAEVDKFLDTPVKRYSSGMYVRLAFAVAAHLEPEILIVDEVLAVGDTGFQKKCLGKIQEVSAGGRTVVFVSHQMAAIQNLCQTGIHLAQGRLVLRGDVQSVISHYFAKVGQDADLSFANRTDRQGNGLLRFQRLSLAGGGGRPVSSLTAGSAAVIEIEVKNFAQRRLKNLRVAVGIDSNIGERLLVLSTHLAREDFAEAPANLARIIIKIPRLALAPGRYGLTLYSAVNGETADWIKNAGWLDVEPGDYYGTGQLPRPGQGQLLMEHSFELCLEDLRAGTE